MVDFNDSNTIGTPAIDIFRVEALQAQADAVAAYEHYKKKDLQGQSPDSSVFHSRLITWFMIHQPYLKRSGKKTKYDSIYSALFANDTDIDKLVEVMLMLNEVLDGLSITKLDTKTRYDTTDTEEDNKQHGL